MQFVPWRAIESWNCTGCGDCCKFYSVVINFPEWLKIIGHYGAQYTISGINKLFIKRRPDGSCAFLYRNGPTSLCGLQHEKPRACQIWPFRVLMEPEYGFPQQSLYHYGKNDFYVYVDTSCKGLRYGYPSTEFSDLILPEFVDLATGRRIAQRKTTGNIRFI